jgi:TonB family protein
MSTLSKETIEATNSATESPAFPTGTATHAASGQLHSDAVSLEVPLKVHGSKVTEVVRGVTPHTEPFEEQTTSMIVFPHGGVLRMSTAVNAGQMLVLTNLKSRQDAICRVIKVRSYSNTASYVEVEFTHRQPGYWGVYFESDGSAAVKETAPASGSDASIKGTAIPGVSDRTELPKQAKMGATLPSNLGVTGKQESSFISIGSQEEVQPAAASTSGSGRKPAQALKVGGQTAVPSTATKAVPSGNNGAKTRDEEQDSSVGIEPLNEDSQTAAQASAHASVREAFGAKLDSDTQESASKQPTNWMLIAACGAALFLAVGGGILLFHHKSGDSAPSAARPAPIAAPVASQPAQASPVPPAVTQPNPKPASLSASVVRESPTVANTKPTKDLPAAVISEQPEQIEASAPSKKTVPSVFGTLNAHPVSTRESAAGPSAPVLDTAVAPTSEQSPLLGITSAPNAAALPPPAFKANGPVPVGGRINEPRLVTRVLPQYPNLARQSHTQGDVGLEIVVDKAGGVSEARVVSGPTVLRQAALDAVRRWKYEPSLLDGQSISVQMLVTIRFRL